MSNSKIKSELKNSIIIKIPLIIILTISLAFSGQSKPEKYIYNFENGNLDNWSILELPESARDRDGNDWSIIEDSISGEKSLHVNTAGDVDDNAIATKNRIVDLSADFNLSFRWRTPDPSNRGPAVRLLNAEGSNLQNRERSDIFERDGIDIAYGGDAISEKGWPFKGKARFNGEKFDQKSLATHEVHKTSVIKRGKNATLYTDGRKNLEETVNSSGIYRLLIGSSGTWGSSSSITFDDIRYQELEDSPEINQSLNETVFIGDGKEMLKAVALNQTVFVAGEYEKVEKDLPENLAPLGVEQVSGLASVDNVNQAFNISRHKYYPGNRKKAVYVSVLAAGNNASLTFRKEEADRDLSNYSIEELQSLFIEKFRPHHVVAADLDSDSGILAAYMAARQGILPVDFDHAKRPYNGKTGVDEWNENNGVIKLQEKIGSAFKSIGANRKTITEGRYVTLLSGPRKLYEDPVEKGLISDPVDGKRYRSDVEYGNLDGDRRIEAGVGRLPEDTALASVVYQRSLERSVGERALVASEYMHTRWPVILASFGGGMWHGKNTGYILERQGYNVTRIVEQRSRPVTMFLELLGMPKPKDAFIKGFMENRKKISRYIGHDSVKTITNLVHIVKAAEMSERLLQVYLEFDWIHWEPLKQDIAFPDEPSTEAARKFALSLLPDRYPELDRENLRSGLEGAHIVFYHGIGNRSKWVLPDSEGYTGKNSFTGREIPRMDNSIIWESSTESGVENAEMKNGFLEKGASTTAGFTGATYSAYTAALASTFFEYGKTTGESWRKAINQLRSGALIYDPNNLLKAGIREKMTETFSLYGNPETVKDPVDDSIPDSSTRCRRATCTTTIRIDTDYSINRGKEKRVVFNATDHLLRTFKPIIPIYRYTSDFRGKVLEASVNENFRYVENVSIKNLNPLSHANESYLNRSLDIYSFPEKTHRINTTDELVYIQAAMQKVGEDARVLEAARLKLKYRSPYTVDLETEGRLLHAEIYSEKERNASLALITDSNRTVRNIRLDEGMNRLALGKLDYGIHSPRAKLFDEKLLASTEEKFRIKQPVNIRLYPRDLMKSRHTLLKVKISNPNSFPVNETLSIETGPNMELGLLENRKKHLSLEAGGSETASWKVIGMREGVSEFRVRNKTETLEVKPATQSTIGLAKSVYASSLSHNGVVKQGADSGSSSMKIVSPGGVLKIKRSRKMEKLKLKTGAYTVTKTQRSGSKGTLVKSEEGTYSRTVENGEVSYSGNLGKDAARKYVRNLETEVSKFEKYLYKK